jgi:hypothetical protein
MQIQAGIDYLSKSMCSNGEPIATSVIVSGGYKDDMELDDGDVIILTWMNMSQTCTRIAILMTLNNKHNYKCDRDTLACQY